MVRAARTDRAGAEPGPSPFPPPSSRVTTTIRRELPEDVAGVRDLMIEVWGRASEAALLDRLRARGDVFSFVALADRRVVGHVIFNPVEVVGAPRGLRALAVGLLAVLPQWRSQGIGSRLVRHALDESRRLRSGPVFVLGPAGFYGRLGFVPAVPLGIRCRWRVPDEIFSVLELEEGELARAKGVVRYPREFSSA